jgi:DNA-binding IclR family transcriptional regulator
MDIKNLEDSDRLILDELRKGRCTPGALVDWTELSKSTIHNHLKILVAAGYVEKIHRSGLYELLNDPCEVEENDD